MTKKPSKLYQQENKNLTTTHNTARAARNSRKVSILARYFKGLIINYAR